MDTELIVENVKKYCALRGVTPTPACRESRAGRSFIANLKGSLPSVEKVYLLAQYLGVTTSELLGEKLPGTPELPDFLLRFQQLTPEGQREVLAFIEFKMGQEQKP